MRENRTLAVCFAATFTAASGCSLDESDEHNLVGHCVPPADLPTSIVLGPDASSIALGDIDADGCSDIAAYVTGTGGATLSIVVAWGDEHGAWAERWERVLVETEPKMPGEPPPNDTRDSSASVVAVGDYDGDGLLDVVTAAGVAFGARDRSLAWQPFPGEADAALFPVALADFEGVGRDEMVRVTPEGRVERCASTEACSLLDPTAPEWPPSPAGFSFDLAVADFDSDGRPDILAGYAWDFPVKSSIWMSSASWQQPRVIENMHAVDYQVGDVDADGHIDVVAQQRTMMPDFPSHTDIWFGTQAGFERRQTIYNYENHNDNAALADVDGDGCLDYLQIGVHAEQVALRRGDCAFLGPHDPSKEVDIGWDEFIGSGVPGVGVQVLDLNNDGVIELVVRHSDWVNAQEGDLRIVPIPPR